MSCSITPVAVAMKSAPPTSVVKLILPSLSWRLKDSLFSPPADELSMSPVVSEGLNTIDILVTESVGVKMEL